jgi:hypothetical protein
MLAACLLMATAQNAAHAQEDLIWTQTASEGFVSLRYGPLDPAAAPLFLLSCFDEMGIAVLDVRKKLEGAKSGEALSIALAAGEAKAEVEGEAMRDDATGMIFAEASDIAVKPVLEILRQPGPISVSVGKATASLSDKGRAQALERFSKDCALD